MADLPFTCTCGKVKGSLNNVGPAMAQGNHARCFCRSCRAAELFAGSPDPGTGGITVYQTTPDRISFQNGQELLEVFSFGPTNLLRWRSACCGALMFNTLRSPRFAFAALNCSRLDDVAALGPVRSQGFIPGPKGKLHHDGMFPLIAGTLWRASAALVSGRWKDTPFFDLATGKPVAPVVIPPQGTRSALLQGRA